VAAADLTPIEGSKDAYKVTMQWGEKAELDPGTDGGVVEQGYVSVSYLTRLEHEVRPDMAHADKGLDALLS